MDYVSCAAISPEMPEGNRDDCLMNIDCTLRPDVRRMIRLRIGNSGRSFTDCGRLCREAVVENPDEDSNGATPRSSRRNDDDDEDDDDDSERSRSPVSSRDCDCYCSLFHDPCPRDDGMSLCASLIMV